MPKKYLLVWIFLISIITLIFTILAFTKQEKSSYQDTKFSSPSIFTQNDPNFYHVWGNAYINVFTKTNGETYLYHQLENQCFIGQAASHGSFQVFAIDTPIKGLTEQAVFKKQELRINGCTCILKIMNGKIIKLIYSLSNIEPAKINCKIINKTDNYILVPVYLNALNGNILSTFQSASSTMAKNFTSSTTQINENEYMVKYQKKKLLSPPLPIHLRIEKGSGILKTKENLLFFPDVTMPGSLSSGLCMGDTVFISLKPHSQTTVSFGHVFDEKTGLSLDDNFIPIIKKMHLLKDKPKQLSVSQWSLLSKEAKWKIMQAVSWTQYRKATDRFAIPQGSVYEYNIIVGSSSGLPWLPNTGDTLRNVGTISVLSILAPDLAKQTLENTMRLQGGVNSLHIDTFGNIPYAWYGNNITVVGAPFISDIRSDIDLEFLHSFYLYIKDSNIDENTLEEWLFNSLDIPFRYDLNPSNTSNQYPQKPFGHLYCSINHLINQVGLGDHNLLLAHDGDWSDNLLASTPGTPLTNKSETVMESLHLCYIAPRLINLLLELCKNFQPSNLLYMRELLLTLYNFYKKVKTGIETYAWSTNGYFMRAFLYGINVKTLQTEENILGKEYIDLNAQIWALLLDSNELSLKNAPNNWQILLFEKVHAILDAPFPLGAHITAQVRPLGLNSMGADMQANTWMRPASILAMAYLKTKRMKKFWSLIWRMSSSNHRKLFPNQRCGSVSGPDALGNNGLSWSSCFIQMSVFPWANLNSNTAWLWPFLYYNYHKHI